MLGRRTSHLRVTLVALAVLVLVPAWVARTVFADRCMSGRSCCGGRPKMKARPVVPDAPTTARRACCATTRVELRAAPSAAPEPGMVASAAPAGTDVEISSATPVRTRLAVTTPRATGPPAYQSRLLL